MVDMRFPSREKQMKVLVPGPCTLEAGERGAPAFRADGAGEGQGGHVLLMQGSSSPWPGGRRPHLPAPLRTSPHPAFLSHKIAMAVGFSRSYFGVKINVWFKHSRYSINTQGAGASSPLCPPGGFGEPTPSRFYWSSWCRIVNAYF